MTMKKGSLDHQNLPKFNRMVRPYLNRKRLLDIVKVYRKSPLIAAEFTTK